MSVWRKLSQNQLVRGSFIFFIGTNLANLLNLIYNLLMGRMLGVEKYGDLGAILSLFSIFSVPISILNLYVVKTVSSYWGKKEKSKIISFLNYLTVKIFYLSLIISVLLVILTPNISRFLNLDNFIPVFIVAVSFLLSGPVMIARSVLQGILSFFYVAINGISETGIKLLIAVILVWANFGLSGALLGGLIGAIVAYLLAVVELKIIFKNIKREENHQLHIKTMLKTLLPVILTSLIITSFLNLDIVLVRHFFAGRQAGEYVALSTMGKISYYLISTVIVVMFPIVSTRVSSGASYILPLLGTLTISSALSIFMIFVYFLFPKLLLGLLYGEKFFGVIPYLGIFSFFIAIFSINSILTHFLLSVSYVRAIYILFFVSLFQGILIFFFHNSIAEVIWINIIVSLAYFLVTFLFIIKKEYNLLVTILSKIKKMRLYGVSRTT